MNPIQTFVWGRARYFEFTVDTSKPTANGLFRLPLQAGTAGVYNFKVDFGDGTVINPVTSSAQIFPGESVATTHTYAIPGVYTIKIVGVMQGWRFAAAGDRQKMMSVKSWGVFRLSPTTPTSAFNGANNLNLPNVVDVMNFNNQPTGAFLQAVFGTASSPLPSLLTVKNLPDYRFPQNADLNIFLANATSYNQNINDLDVSKVQGFSGVFNGDALFNSPLDKWNMSNATSIADMLSGCDAFDQPISMWDVHRVTDMSGFLTGAIKFNKNMDGWNHPVTGSIAATAMNSLFSGAALFNNGLAPGVAGVFTIQTPSATTFSSMFNNCDSFNCDVRGLETVGVTSMSLMFNNCLVYNQPMDTWNTSTVTNIASIFATTGAFNQPLTTNGNFWNVSNVTLSGNMFGSAIAFNQNLNSWNTIKFTSLSTMFSGATNFNNGLASGVPGALTWVTPAVTIMPSAFMNATSFNCDISQFDCRLVTDFGSMFQGATKFNNGGQPGIGTWLLNQGAAAAVTMDLMFYGAIAFNQPLNGWVTTRVSNMSAMFQGATIFNNGLPAGQSGVMQWDTGRVTTMANMFANCPAFNQNISGWSLVGTTPTTSIAGMFNLATAFNQKLDAWDTSSIGTSGMNNTFELATAFNNGEAPGVFTPMLWETQNVTGMAQMFDGCTAFNQDISSWDTTKVTTIGTMFRNCPNFNSPLPWGAKTANMVTMSFVFNNCTSFNQSINDWNVSKVTTFANMFQGATSYNQPMNNWQINTVSAAIGMGNMFNGATAFNQDIGSWNISKVNSLTNFMTGKSSTNFSSANMDSIYNNWPKNLLTAALTPNFGSIRYTVASAQGRGLLTRTNAQPSMIAIQNNGSGLFRITVNAAHGLVTGNRVYVNGNANWPAATGLWTVTVISTTAIDLQGSVFSGSGTVGTSVRCGYGWTIVDGGSSITDNMVAHYSLNSVLTDSTGLSGTATMVGITYIAGITGNAAVFNAATDLIDIADTTNLSFTDGVTDLPFSMNMWVRFIGFDLTGNWLFNKRSDSPGGQMEWQFAYNTANGKMQFIKFEKSSTTDRQTLVSSFSPSLNTWYNFTITDDGSASLTSMKLYVNAALDASTTTNTGTYTGMRNGTSIARMGAAAWGAGSTSHIGYLEDVSVWKGRAISQEEITYIYNQGVGKAYPFL